MALGPIQDAFSRAAAEQRDWFASYAAEHDRTDVPGALLPYHPNFRITEAEYAALANAYSNPTVVDAEHFVFTVHYRGDAQQIDAPPPYEYPSSVRVSANGVLQYGDIRVESPEKVAKRRGKFGTWSGMTWSYDGTPTGSMAVDTLEVSIGVVESGDRRFLLLNRVKIRDTQLLEKRDLLIWIVP